MARVRAGENDAKKRRGRPPGSSNSKASTSRVAKPKTTAKGSTKKKTGTRSQEHQEDELSVAPPTQTRSSQTRKRRIHDDADEIAAEPTKNPRKYVQLETKTKRIPQNVIETWPLLSPQVLEQMSTVMKDAKKDIANTQRDERKVMAAHNSLNPLVKKLVHHLAASKIPPQAKDYHFSIDKLTERNGQLFREVTTARHSKQLLQEQVEVARKLLSKDERQLDELKNDAKEWRTEWKHQRKHGRNHPLLLDSGDLSIDDDGPEDIRLRPAAEVGIPTLNTPNAELSSILDQLRRSLENMQGNHVQVEGIDQAMADTQTALDDVLFRHVSAEQYAML